MTFTFVSSYSVLAYLILEVNGDLQKVLFFLFKPPVIILVVLARFVSFFLRSDLSFVNTVVSGRYSGFLPYEGWIGKNFGWFVT